MQPIQVNNQSELAGAQQQSNSKSKNIGNSLNTNRVRAGITCIGQAAARASNMDNCKARMQHRSTDQTINQSADAVTNSGRQQLPERLSTQARDSNLEHTENTSIQGCSTPAHNTVRINPTTPPGYSGASQSTTAAAIAIAKPGSARAQ